MVGAFISVTRYFLRQYAKDTQALATAQSRTLSWRSPRLAIVSVITGIYNSEKYLETYFRMLDQQTFRDWEAILVDDGSTDQSMAVIRAKVAMDPRYKVFDKHPEGFPSRSRAFGLAKATGEYVAFCDHDDFWAPQKLELQVHLMKTVPGVSILHTDRIVWRELTPPAVMTRYDGAIAAVPYSLQAPREVIYRGLRIIFSSFMGPRRLVDMVGFRPEMKGVDDFYLFVRLASLGVICHIDLPLTYYFAHQGNLSHTNNLFVKGFYDVHAALLHDAVPEEAKASVLAQAMRTEAVALLDKDRPRALKLLLASLRQHFIGSTLSRLIFLLLTLPIPLRWLKPLLQRVKRLKFAFPTMKDVFR